MTEIVHRYFGYRSDFNGPLFIVYRAMFQKSKKYENSLYFIDEEVFDIFLGKWIHRDDTVHHAWVMGNTDLDFVEVDEIQEYFKRIKSRRDYLIWRASNVTDKSAMVVNYPLGRWSDQRQYFPYIQAIRDSNENWIIEVSSNKFLKLNIWPSEITKLREMGYKLPDNRSNKPNYWKVLAAETPPEEVADEFLRVLEEIFQLYEPDDFFTEFPVPEYFTPFEEVID
jgi:hypothetical protein